MSADGQQKLGGCVVGCVQNSVSIKRGCSVPQVLCVCSEGVRHASKEVASESRPQGEQRAWIFSNLVSEAAVFQA